LLQSDPCYPDLETVAAELALREICTGDVPVVGSYTLTAGQDSRRPDSGLLQELSASVSQSAINLLLSFTDQQRPVSFIRRHILAMTIRFGE